MDDDDRPKPAASTLPEWRSLCCPEGVPQERYVLYPEGMDAFMVLYELTSSQRRLVRALMQYMPWEGAGTTFEIGYESLAKRMRIDHSQIENMVHPRKGCDRRRVNEREAHARLTMLVTIKPGKKHTKGRHGSSTVYDLRRFFQAYGEWRKAAFSNSPT